MDINGFTDMLQEHGYKWYPGGLYRKKNVIVSFFWQPGGSYSIFRYGKNCFMACIAGKEFSAETEGDKIVLRNEREERLEMPA